MDKCYNSTTNATSLDSVCHEYWFTNAPSITAIAPLSVEDGTDVWVFKSKSELDSSLPISKPLLVDCPMPVCAFGISGPYADLQRCLIYANLVLAIIAAATPILRGVAQLYLATTGMSATVHYFAILGLRDRHFIDMDILPALMYAFSGFIATMFWSMLRVSSVITSFRQVMTYQVLPYAVAFLYLVLVCILLVICPDKPAAVLLESDTAYRLTSICYKDGTGSVVPWSGYLSYSIRQSSELQFILPPDGSSGQSAETFLIPLKWTAIGAFVMVGAYFLFLLLIIIKSRTRWSRGEPWEVDLSFLACFPKPLQRL
ncbi:hypothetical protein QQX98_012410 [Neonectria punicea]|uniref:Uncharacterized protein n=1 Tax=Neonectria punicea TaxID=979145 RepID=A0ABR1GJ90_9HYPO